MNIKKKTVTKIARALLVVMLVALFCACFASATADIGEGVKKGLGETYGLLCTIVIPIAAVVLGFAAFKIFAGGEKGMESAKKIILYTLVAVAIIFLAPVIAENVGNWFASYGSNTKIFS